MDGRTNVIRFNLKKKENENVHGILNRITPKVRKEYKCEYMPKKYKRLLMRTLKGGGQS